MIKSHLNDLFRAEEAQKLPWLIQKKQEEEEGKLSRMRREEADASGRGERIVSILYLIDLVPLLFLSFFAEILYAYILMSLCLDKKPWKRHAVIK